MFALLQPLVCIQVNPTQVTIRHLDANTTLCEPAELAVDAQGKKPRVLGAGAQARAAAAAVPGARLLAPFAHPRSMVSDFLSAESLLRALLRQSLGKRLLPTAPRVVMHPMGSPEGDFTAVELRAFRELGLGIGASHVHVWTGRPLTDDELRSRRFPTQGGQLRDA
jgi:rod shape-determining protein MreB and related proteins